MNEEYKNQKKEFEKILNLAQMQMGDGTIEKIKTFVRDMSDVCACGEELSAVLEPIPLIVDSAYRGRWASAVGYVNGVEDKIKKLEACTLRPFPRIEERVEANLLEPIREMNFDRIAYGASNFIGDVLFYYLKSQCKNVVIPP
ncbi:MAG: hypothetical protein HA495_09130 [Thaumarchaeota archaeon]|nr:hypothetical protein [Nitrososphaerota archaeon]